MTEVNYMYMLYYSSSYLLKGEGGERENKVYNYTGFAVYTKLVFTMRVEGIATRL